MLPGQAYRGCRTLRASIIRIVSRKEGGASLHKDSPSALRYRSFELEAAYSLFSSQFVAVAGTSRSRIPNTPFQAVDPSSNLNFGSYKIQMSSPRATKTPDRRV